MTPEADRLIDRAVPRWDFAERHARLVHAPAPLVWRALRPHIGSLDELRAASVAELNRPMLDGWVRIATDFRLDATDGSTLLSTETRVLATGPTARRRFRLYWLVIRGGSGLIRRELLHSVARRAERAR